MAIANEFCRFSAIFVYTKKLFQVLPLWILLGGSLKASIPILQRLLVGFSQLPKWHTLLLVIEVPTGHLDFAEEACTLFSQI